MSVKVLTSPKTTFLSGFSIHSINLPIHSLIRQSIPSFINPFPHSPSHSIQCPIHYQIHQFIPSFAKPFHSFANPIPQSPIHSIHLPIHSLIYRSIPFIGKSIFSFANPSRSFSNPFHSFVKGLSPGWLSGLSYYLLLEQIRSFSTSWTSTLMLHRFFCLIKRRQLFWRTHRVPTLLRFSSPSSRCEPIINKQPFSGNFSIDNHISYIVGKRTALGFIWR